MDAILSRMQFRHGSEGHALAVIRPAIAGILAALLLLTAVVLISRRLTDALTQPLPATATIAVGLIVASVALATRLLFHRDDQKGRALDGWFRKLCLGSPSVSLPLIALSITLPASGFVALAGLWLIVLGEEAWYWKSYHRRTKRGADPNRLSGNEAIAPGEDAPRSAESVAEIDWQSTSLTQRLTYERTESGTLTVEGWLRAEFQPQQRIAAVHVAFCPPLADSPEVEAEPLDGPDCTVRPTLVLPWGVRWEIKLDVPATEPQHVILGFHATERKE